MDGTDLMLVMLSVARRPCFRALPYRDLVSRGARIFGRQRLTRRQ